MARATPYRGPTELIAAQGSVMHSLYKEDSDENKQTLATVGLTEEHFEQLGKKSAELLDLEIVQEERKQSAAQEQAEASAATQAVLNWRKDEVIPRARLIFEDDPRFVHFRSGKLRSYRPASVIREGRLLVSGVKRFAHLPESKAIGLDEALAARGEELLAALVKEDTEGELAIALQKETTDQLRDLELEVSQLIAEVEKRVVIAFPTGHPARRRYRANELREYVARQKGRGGKDPTVGVDVDDPAPDADLEPVRKPEPEDA